MKTTKSNKASIKTKIKTSTTSSNGRDDQNKVTSTTTKKSSDANKKSEKQIRKSEEPSGSSRKSDSSKSKVTDVKKVTEKTPSKRNVMNSIHNVTVASPPSSANRERRSVSMVDVKLKPKELNHQRSRTRTILPEESMLNKIEQPPLSVIVVPVVKEPVAFEINFEEAKKPKMVEKLESSTKDEEDCEYESDFESYESDFEDEVPSVSEHEDDLENEEDSNDDDKNSEEVEDSGNETQEMTKKTSASSHFESIDATMNSHDSVLSYDRTFPSRNLEIFKRGKEIMKKVVFDTMNFDIYEMKPLPYDTFIAIYGDRDMIQVSTQIDSLQISEETQTDEIEKVEKWIQYPARFTKEGVKVPKSKLYNEEKFGVGEGSVEKKSMKDNEADRFENVVENINNFSKFSEPPIKSTKHFDSRGYRNFLNTSELFISRALEKNDRKKLFQPSLLEFCDGFIHLEHDSHEILKETKVFKIYTNQQVNSFFLTTHRRNNTRMNFVCLWDSVHSNRPLKILQSWSEITCISIHENQKEFIVAGCDDGTICMWDVTEFIEWIDNESLAIKPCQIVSPNSGDKISEEIVAIKNLNYPEFKNLSSQSKITQFCSLNRAGIIVIWTLTTIEYSEDDLLSEKFQSNFLDFLHVKSRARLVKNITIDLNFQLKEVFEKTQRKKSAFEKTRYYFENDLFSDKVLKELQEINSLQGNKTNENIPNFTGCETSFNEIYAATQMNHFIGLSRLNFTDTRKVFTSDFNSNSISVMKIHPMKPNVIAVGHLNGDVRFMKIFEDENPIQILTKNKKKLQRTKNFEADELAAQQSSGSLDIAKEEIKINFDKNIFNPFELWQGPVHVIEFDKRGNFMFAIIGNQLRVYDCIKNCEIEFQIDLSLIDLKCVGGADCCEYLIFLTTGNEILVNKLKN